MNYISIKLFFFKDYGLRSQDSGYPWRGVMTGRGPKGELLVLAMFGFLTWVLVTRVCSDVTILYTYNSCTFQYVCYILQ